MECGSKLDTGSIAVAAPASLPVDTCPECGEPVHEGFIFCMGCGARLATREPAAAGVSEPVSAIASPKTVAAAPTLSAEAASPGAAPSAEPEAQAGTCSVCGALVKEGYLFCSECGAPVEEDAASGEDDATTVIVETPTATMTRVRTGEVYALHVPEVLGKGSQATCHITGNSAISRQHARIGADSGMQANRYFIEDLHSTNKTAVNGIEVPSGRRAALPSRCTITLADEDFMFSAE